MPYPSKLPLPASATASTVLRTQPGIYEYRAWENISVGVWVGQATREAVVGIYDIMREMNERHPNGHSSVVFILDQLPAPTAEAQQEFTKLFSAPAEHMYSAVVLEGSGFWASGLRAMIRNAHDASNGAMHIRIGTTVDEIMQWFPEVHEKATGRALHPRLTRHALLQIRETGEANARSV